MSFKAVQAKIAARSGVGMERAGAMLASTTRKNMKKAGMSTKHGIPPNVYGKMKKMSGMSEHMMVDCSQQKRNHKTMPIGM